MWNCPFHILLIDDKNHHPVVLKKSGLHFWTNGTSPFWIKKLWTILCYYFLFFFFFFPFDQQVVISSLDSGIEVAGAKAAFSCRSWLTENVTWPSFVQHFPLGYDVTFFCNLFQGSWWLVDWDGECQLPLQFTCTSQYGTCVYDRSGLVGTRLCLSCMGFFKNFWINYH